MYAYGIKDTWDDTFEILIKQLLEGGVEDDYKKLLLINLLIEIIKSSPTKRSYYLPRRS